MTTLNQQATRTLTKQIFTSHKSDFSFSSPQEDTQTVLKRGLLQTSRADMMRNRMELFTDLKENTNIVTLINKTYTKEFVDQIRAQQAVQVQKLLMEISRLHDMLDDQENMHRHTVQRMKEESEQIALLRISNLKQSQYSQIQIMDLQLRKMKEALQQKTARLEQLQKSSSRKLQNLTNQNQTLKSDLRELVQKKNLQLYQLTNRHILQTEETQKKQSQQLEQLKSIASKQLKKVIMKLEDREQKISSISAEYESTVKENLDLQRLVEQEKRELYEKLEEVVREHRERQGLMVESLKSFYEAELEQSQEVLRREKETVVGQIEHLIKIINMKDEEARKVFVFRETEKIQSKMQISNAEQEVSYLKQLIGTLKHQHIEQLEILKVKMGVLHKSDLQALVRIYQAKIQSLTREIEYGNKQMDRLAKEVKKQRDSMYEMKKKFQYKISVLREEISDLRLGAGNNEREMKEKLENQKSMMMLTSRNFIKENQAKEHNIRFYEEQLRKLRQLLQIQAQQVEDSQHNVQQKIKLAQEQLSRLSNKILQVKTQAEQSQKKLKHTIDQKNKQIKRLNILINTPQSTQTNTDSTANELKRLDAEICKKEDEIRTLKNQLEDLVGEMKIVKAENQRLFMENQIYSEDAKMKYKVISDKNLADLKAFYERRMQELENDKKELDRIISSQSQQITELIKKYKNLEEGMKQLLKQTKKRGDLQARIISLGMDTNLVKNMSELFHR